MLDAYRDLIDELLETPTAIRDMVGGSDDAATPPETKRLIAELRDRDRIVLGRLQTMTRQDNPYLPTLRVEARDADEPIAELLEEMETARGDLVSLLINLSLKDWERKAIHETEGEISLSDETERHVEFDEAQRRRLRELMS